MKKSMLWTGVAYVLVGCALFYCGVVLDTQINALLWGFGGAAIGPGLVMIYKYIHWSQPKNAAKYVEKMEEETIELHDERKEMLRNKTGRIVVSLNLAMTSAAMVVLSISGKMEWIAHAEPIIITLAIFFVAQILLSNLVFRVLEKRN